MNLRVPHFEGRPVEGGTRFKMTGAVPMDQIDGVTVSIDDVVSMHSIYKCVNVHHDTNAKGELVRVHVMRPVTLELTPFNPQDPDDDGIKRALPRVIERRKEEEPPMCTCGTGDSGHTGDCALIRAMGMGEALESGEKVYIGFSQPAES